VLLPLRAGSPLRTVVVRLPFEDCCVGVAPLEDWCGAAPFEDIAVVCSVVFSALMFL
jgi:hypothetical protein